MYRPLICFQDDPSWAHAPPQKISIFLPPPFTLLGLSLCLYVPLSLHPPCLLLSSFSLTSSSHSSPRRRLLSLPAPSVLQLVVLKVWSVGRLVGEGAGGGGAFALPLNKLCFPHKRTKGSSLIKTLCFSSRRVPNTHCPSPKTQTRERDPKYGNGSLFCGR